MKKKRLAALIILSMLCIMLPVSVAADGERDDIVMEAQVGFDGYFRLEQWTPIIVEIENNGEDIHGNLEVVANQNSTTGVLFSRPAVVPKNSKKRFVIYVQVNSIQKVMNINLVEDGKNIKTYEVKGLMPLTWSKYLLGVVTDDKAGMSYWWNVLGGDTIFTNHETVQLEAQSIPNRKEILDNFTVLVFDNVDTSLLTEEQQDALALWIEGGGIMIVGTGANGDKTLSGLMPEIIPLQPGEVRRINAISELSRISNRKLPDDAMLHIMNLRADGGEFVVRDGEHGMVWKHEKGRGYIFVSAFDMGLEPVIDWAGNKIFWSNLLPAHVDARTVSKLQNPEMQREMGLSYGMDVYYQIRDALSNIQAMDIPSFTGLLVLLLAYLAVVGPINYIVLKKLDKREWAWLTIPLLVVLFSVGIYTMGYTRKGNEVIANTISAVRLQPSSNSAQMDTYVGVFIPKKGDYTISINKDVLMTMFSEGYREYYNPNKEGGKQSNIIQARVNQGNPASLELYDVNVWTMRALSMSNIKPDFGTLQSDLYYSDGKVSGQVTNNTPYPLNDLVIYTLYGYQEIGNIASGESKQVDFRVSTSTSNNSRSQSIYQMVDQIYPYPPGGRRVSGGEDNEEREQWVRRSILEGLLVRPVETKLGIADDGSFVRAFAFCDANLGEDIQVNGKEPKELYYRSLVMADMDIAYEKDGLISIPPGHIKATIDKELSDDINPELGGIYLDRGQAVFAFSMNPYKEIEFFKVEINASALYGNSLLSVYDVENKEFVDIGDGISINQIQGTISIEPGDLHRYVDAQGNLQIKAETDEGKSITMQFPSLAIEGRRR